MGYWKNIFTDQMILDSGIDEETITHKCPCGKGEIVEYHDNTPGFREHDVYIRCEKCSKKYTLDLSKGVHNWKLIPKC